MFARDTTLISMLTIQTSPTASYMYISHRVFLLLYVCSGEFIQAYLLQNDIRTCSSVSKPMVIQEVTIDSLLFSIVEIPRKITTIGA